jgi:predicted Fe-Mo cluster-binding NifX family protein
VVVGIPTWMGRVSPVLDVATRFWIVHCEENIQVSHQEVLIEHSSPNSLVADLRHSGVDILICGAVSQPLLQELLRSKVQVLPHICGNIVEVVSAFLADTLDQPEFKMPGCRADQCSFHHGYRHRHGRGHKIRHQKNI